MERSKMHIAVDAMGGDFAPDAIVTGAFEAAVEQGISILLVGQRDHPDAQEAGLVHPRLR